MTISSLRAALLVAALVLPQDAAWTPARPDYRWTFPRDHWAHPAYRTEWWYLTGHLAAAGDSAPRFGYQFTFFRIGLLPGRSHLDSDWASRSLIMGHIALTDERAGTHTFAEVLYRTTPVLGGFGAPGDSVIAWSRAPAGTAGRWSLRWNGRGFDIEAADDRSGLALTLHTEAERPLVLQGPNGYSRKGAGPTSASQYYSFTRLSTAGTVRSGGATVAVHGRSWMDTEFGSNQLDSGVAGWDWFSLQLDDGRDIMIYQMRDSSGAVTWGGATVLPPDGPPRYLGPDAVTLRTEATWTSPATRAPYPARWTLDIPSEQLTLDLRPTLADQENRSVLATRLFYWEGAVHVRSGGRPVGRGFAELTGYGRGLRPAI